MNVNRAQQAQNAITPYLQANNQLNKLSWVMGQAAGESEGFNSPVSESDNNLTGIKFANQLNATPGTMSPEGNRYARFADLDAWAHAFYHELTKGSNPLGASNIEDFAARLKQNGYFGAPLDQYITMIKSWLPSLKKYLSITTTAIASLFLPVLIFLTSLFIYLNI